MNERVEDLIGRTVHGRDGKLGKVDHVFRDKQTDAPTWVSVSTGGVRSHKRLIPADALRPDGEDLRTPLATSVINDAPGVDDRELSPADEERLRHHYDTGGRRDDRQPDGDDLRRSAGSPASQATTGQRDTDPGVREEFGGVNWGAAFFGWLVAIGLGALLTALVSAAGAAVGLTGVSQGQATREAGTIGIVGAIVLLIVLAIAYYAGGYVAGRMSRFDGGRQGVGVWVIGLVITILIAIAGAIFGAQYNVLASLNLPSIPTSGSSLAGGAAITLLAILVVTLLAALVGGKAGQRYHRKIDRLAQPH